MEQSPLLISALLSSLTFKRNRVFPDKASVTAICLCGSEFHKINIKLNVLSLQLALQLDRKSRWCFAIHYLRVQRDFTFVNAMFTCLLE